MKRQVRMLVNEQRDLLSPAQIANLENGVRSMSHVLGSRWDKKRVAEEMAKLEKVANDNLKPYPAASVRENVKEILVAIVTIMAFTTFFLQLTKIPTGSMQPTLFGITHVDYRGQPEVKFPNFLTRLKDYWVWGVQYAEFVAPEDGVLTRTDPPQTIIPFVKRQTFYFNNRPHTIWFPPDSLFGGPDVTRPRSGVFAGMQFKKGETVFKVKVTAGDHLLVDRFTYNFRKPERGEIIVFKTRGIPGLPQDQLYIKRLVGLSGERIQINDESRLVIDGKPLSASTRRFEMVYTQDNESKLYPYRGHVNDHVAGAKYGMGGLAPQFPTPDSVFQVGSDRYMAMGDNTLNSLDSRAWGDFDRRNLIGKCWFVYWPFTDRFGWGYR